MTVEQAVSIHGPPEGRPNPDSLTMPCEVPKCFNPRPTRRQAEPGQVPHGAEVVLVSIHGPPDGRPNPGSSRLGCWTLRQFQSTAHPKAGRTPSAEPVRRGWPVFQSTAHPKAGRTRRDLLWLLALDNVSIHGPPEGRPNPTTCASTPITPGFQSTAHPKAGRTA